MKTIKSLAVAMAAMSFVACSNEEGNVVNNQEKGIPVQFNMSIGGMSQSRTITGDGTGGKRSVDWRDGDAVGIFVNGVDPIHNYIYNEGDGNWGQKTSEDAIYLEEGEQYKFHAYYPNNKDIVTSNDGLKLNVSVLDDQNKIYEDGNTGYDLSDVLMAETNLEEYAGEEVELKYSHAFAMVEVLVSGSDVTEAPTSVKLRNIRRFATVTLSSKSVDLNNEAALENVLMCKVEPVQAEGSYLYRAIVPAQSVAKDEMLLEVALANGKTYVFKSPEVKYEQAKFRRIEAVIGEGKAGLTFPAGSIDSWEPSEELPPVDGEEKEIDLIEGYYINELTAETFEQVGSINTILYKAGHKDYRKETFWCMSTYVDGANSESVSGTLENDGDGNYFKMSGSFSNSYYKSGIFFHYNGEYEKSYYKLTLKAKLSDTTTQLNFNAFVRTSLDTDGKSNDAWFFASPKGNGGGQQRIDVKTQDWTEYNAYFDFTHGCKDVYGNTVMEEITSYPNAMFDLAFIPSQAINEGTLCIKDVRLVKITEGEFNAQKK